MDLGSSDAIRQSLTRLSKDTREDIISAWEKDYTDMKDDMIIGDKPIFDELMDMMKTLQEKFRNP